MKFALRVTWISSIVRRAGCVPSVGVGGGSCLEHLGYLTASRLEDAEDAAFTGR